MTINEVYKRVTNLWKVWNTLYESEIYIEYRFNILYDLFLFEVEKKNRYVMISLDWCMFLERFFDIREKSEIKKNVWFSINALFTVFN